MMRKLFFLLTILLVVVGSTAPLASAKDHKDDKDQKDDRKITAEACKKNGWKDLADDDDKPFKNQGQCQKYAKDGGELFRLDDDDDGDDDSKDAVTLNDDDDDADDNGKDSLTLSIDDEEPSLTIVDGTEPWDGYLEGTGLTPGEELTKVTFKSDRETLNLTSPVGTIINDDGTFKTERIIYWCSEFHGYGETTGTVTVEDSAGETYSQTFEMETYCGPKDE